MTTEKTTLCYARDPYSDRICVKEVAIGTEHAGPHVWKTMKQLLEESRPCAKS